MIDIFLAGCILVAAVHFVVGFAILVSDPEQLRHEL